MSIVFPTVLSKRIKTLVAEVKIAIAFIVRKIATTLSVKKELFMVFLRKNDDIVNQNDY